MQESTARQLAGLATLRASTDAEAAGVLAELVDRPAVQVLGLIGRVGLALSGGGFRASLFHLGVLARLAELDVLRHVEVLSCVSGGSIVGTHYYLELRRRLQATPDDGMTREEYIDIVRTVQRDFYAATRRNLKWRALTNPVAVVRTLVEPGYNRTVRVGQLLDRTFYRPLLDGQPPTLGRLAISPLEGPKSFDPRHHNWRRSAKVPLLILNATSLNTGHNWQFTASWMGEPCSFIDPRTDANYRLGRVTLRRGSGRWEDVSLGQAVAASASVPGLLEPVHVDGLYPGKHVRLVDGGVCDNLGIYGLLEEDCTVLLVSDASGQMNSDDHPPVWPWATLRRSNSILMSRVRSTSLSQLDDLRSAGRLRGLMHVHLKQDLHGELVTPEGTVAPGQGAEDCGRTSYGIPRIVQRQLAGIRTDLDVFSPAEAYTLMLSGYRMVTEAFPRDLPDFPAAADPPVEWDFQVVEPALDDPPHSPRAAALARLLNAPAGAHAKSARR